MLGGDATYDRERDGICLQAESYACTVVTSTMV